MAENQSQMDLTCLSPLEIVKLFIVTNIQYQFSFLLFPNVFQMILISSNEFVPIFPAV